MSKDCFVSMGLDVSCLSTGIVVLGAHADGPLLLHAETVTPKSRGMQRCSDIAERVIAVAEKHAPDRAVIEGYGGGFKNSLIPLVEVGTVVRYFVRQMGIRWLEPAPTQLKLFVLGKGVGDKDQMLLQVFKRWGYEAANGDVADAYGLACIGLGHAGRLRGMNQKMLEVIGTLKVI